MLSAECARLAALEVLCPTAALEGNEDFPTLAGDRILDTRLAVIDDLDPEQKFTPVVSLFTADASAQLRGDIAASDDVDLVSTLEVVAELAVAATDENGDAFADAMPADDWDARLVLAALCAQVRRALQFTERGYLFRRFVRHVRQVSEETFSVPQIGARWHRVTMRFELSLPDDTFDEASGLPEPIATLSAILPATSPARAKLEALAGHFSAFGRTPLAGVDFSDGGQTGFTVETE
ncbi:hypothetical protein [Oricola thermophila]|uniref:Uncharacterized protein n=1 Tax=Oricola thermophila TaxID=2742145 RepID=A0A6N1VKG4_9HYPH|nr:hypothetical protein [Oricola thermophila]QKV20245.1 hypothetical protein HTY61_18200 [Oricola thermophila]